VRDVAPVVCALPDYPTVEVVVKPRPVLLEWVDSTHLAPGAWFDREAAVDCGACDIVTVAWLIGKDADTYTLAQSITEADDCTGLFVVPRACVKTVRRLKP
jgi:hypothetical protein